MSKDNSFNYKSAGVDIDAGNQLVDLIKPYAKSTARVGVEPNLGGFGALFDIKKCGFKDPILVSATDGVGTKLKVAIAVDKSDDIGIDLVAMSVNDLVVQGAQPLFFLDYYACSKLDPNHAANIIKGIAKGCQIAGCALIGGETAEMPGIYSGKDYDLAGFAVGAVERDGILPTTTHEGDVLIGMKSSGLHSNGFSLVRYIIENKGLSYHDKVIDDKFLYEYLLEPTRIYVKSCLEIAKTNKIKAFAHITGGGIYENINRVISDNLSIKLDLNSFQRPEIFNFLQKEGNIEDSEMIRTFNCGVGMVAIVAAKDVEEIRQILTNLGEEVFVIGKLIAK